MAKKYYVVWSGRKTGIFDNWNECKDSIHGYSGAKYKSYPTKDEAEEAFTNGLELQKSSSGNPTKEDLKSGDYIIPDHNQFIEQGDVVMYTDGSLIQGRVKNMSGTIGGYGAVLMHKSGEREISGALRNTTVSRMELMACIKALEALKTRCKVHIYSDSSYVVNTINLNWKRKKNQDLWNRLDELLSMHNVSVYWVSGHAGLEGNERADKLATGASNHVRDNQIHDHPEDVVEINFKPQMKIT